MVAIKKYMNIFSSRRNSVLQHTESNACRYTGVGITGISAFMYTKGRAVQELSEHWKWPKTALNFWWKSGQLNVAEELWNTELFKVMKTLF